MITICHELASPKRHHLILQKMSKRDAPRVAEGQASFEQGMCLLLPTGHIATPPYVMLTTDMQLPSARPEEKTSIHGTKRVLILTSRGCTPKGSTTLCKCCGDMSKGVNTCAFHISVNGVYSPVQVQQ